MLYEAGPESHIRLRKGDLEKIGIRTESAVLSGNAGVAGAFDASHRQARAMARSSAHSELQRLCDQLAGAWRR